MVAAGAVRPVDRVVRFAGVETARSPKAFSERSRRFSGVSASLVDLDIQAHHAPNIMISKSVSLGHMGLLRIVAADGEVWKPTALNIAAYGGLFGLLN